MHRLATVLSAQDTNRQTHRHTDRRQYDANSRSYYCVYKWSVKDWDWL